MMIRTSPVALFDFQPLYCPKCGHKIVEDQSDYKTGFSYSCAKCDLSYQFSIRKEMLELSKLNGDLAQYCA